MKWQEDNLDVLQNLEFAIVEVWRANPAMTDYSAQRAYEAARQYYRAELRGQPPKEPALTGLDAVAFAAMKQVCKFRLGATPARRPPAKKTPCPCRRSRSRTLACLQELGKSVERHTRSGGRQGYLQFMTVS